MKEFKAKEYPYNILYQTDNNNPIYPYLRSFDGDKSIWNISPYHGRSYVVGKREDGRYIISKGNGLSYSQYNFLHTGEFGDDTFGLLLIQDAIRDFTIGIEVEQLGIKTNHMEYVIQLKNDILLTNGHSIKPVLLQYTVECPYRISDAAFPIYSQEINKEVRKWEKFNIHGFDKSHLIAASVLLKNLRTLHDHQILHNAISIHNYTWALELLDFELACSPENPYTTEDDQRHAKDLFKREVVYTYEIINHIAFYLNETIDYKEIDDLFNHYDFKLP